jgi:RNA polymerase sigma-B factor
MDNVELLISQYDNLARKLSRNYENHPEYDDILQAARIGLGLAAQRFDSSKGYEFCTLAYPYIQGYIKKYFRDHYGLIKLPRDKREEYKSLQLMVSLDDPGPDGILPDIPDDSALIDVEWIDLREKVKLLPPASRTLIEKLFFEEIGICELAKQYGCTPQALNTKKNTALRRLKNILVSSDLAPE